MIDFEREFEELVRELRALPTDAPESVRERVRALGEPAPSRSLPSLPWRRSLFVLAPVCALGLVVAAVVHGVLNSVPNRQAVSGSAVGSSALHKGLEGSRQPEHFGAVTTATPDFGLSLAPVAGQDAVVPPNPGRHQDYQATMTLRVRDLDALTDRTNEAMRIVRSYGGYVASVQQSTQAGQPGQADLVLRVPIGRVETALVQLSDLGTVLNRQLSIVDLEQALRQQQERIVRLKVFIARATEQLKGDLPADVRLRLQLQLQQARADLSRATRAHKATLDEASFSRVSLSLTTQKPVVPAQKGGVGRFERAARDAGSFLAGAGAVILFLLIILSPLLVLAVAGLLGLRTYRRREERRLLASA
ncbi:MAG: DUF4349 domain-containing protein [Burkholderiales bacterium]